jgi:hypothetical protein
MASRGSVTFALGGPGGRAGGFTVDRAGSGLLPGQAIGPNQWCPVVPTASADDPMLVVEVSVHPQTGFAEELMAGGVVNRVPVYGPGTTVASGAITIAQRARGGAVPVLTGPIELPADFPIKGQLQLAGSDGKWRYLGWSGRLRDLPVDTGVVKVLVVDFVAPEVGQVTGADPLGWVRADIERWLTGDPSSLIGAAGWRRSGVEPPLDVAFAEEGRGSQATPGQTFRWQRAADASHDLRIGKFDDRLRVVIAWRHAALDADALAAIDDAASWDL